MGALLGLPEFGCCVGKGGAVEVVSDAANLAAGYAADDAGGDPQGVRSRPGGVCGGGLIGVRQPPECFGALAGDADDVFPDGGPFGRAE